MKHSEELYEQVFGTLVEVSQGGKKRDFGKNDDEKNRFLFLYLRVLPKATSVD